ncbi:hypothetical protein BS47DRAFT_1360265 [Hydnum rufescens UP504]|uniref:Uncharacterized protein n=1 Tax=Hydnum rufescens UP504 TaxID=1448309 RepID=A0A9P6DZW8_9AGAM|nr:hypothetical protein BS47DRAFT_1360265 [Hydnum rufescens UP504]
MTISGGVYSITFGTVCSQSGIERAVEMGLISMHYKSFLNNWWLYVPYVVGYQNGSGCVLYLSVWEGARRGGGIRMVSSYNIWRLVGKCVLEGGTAVGVLVAACCFGSELS